MGVLDADALEAEVCLGLASEVPSLSPLIICHGETSWHHEDEDALGGYESATSAKSFTGW